MWALLVVLLGAAGVARGDGSRCEEITIPMCRGIGYNLTAMPNELNHDTQEEAGLEVHQFWPLVEIRCSKDLLFFLCSMYAPICIEDYHKPLLACRSVCERARNGCSPLMEHYGFKWPDRMSCDKFPRHGDPDDLCMDKPDGLIGAPATSVPASMPRSTRKPPTAQLNNKCKNKNGKGCTKDAMVDGKDCQCRCRSPLVPISRDSLLYNRSVSVSSVENCALPCFGVFYSQVRNKRVKLANWILLVTRIPNMSGK